ncbi:hypothetical protein QFC22_005446 [Naganishia vaughanmartiniae]|uniref:Uncharacterized protein n=1 Tax=Naganishia vaughanmartiniae TaxID=1424756 RepID=A0ACC2WUN3_9TREE|nr:hypothetical protein QFC22_005446 [Naganishia vaughanmartiniae]
MPQSRFGSMYTDVIIPAAVQKPKSTVSPLTNSNKTNAGHMLEKMDQPSRQGNENINEKIKGSRLEHDRHNLMGVASIWAPRPSEKDLHSAYPPPTLSPTHSAPSPGLSPSAAMFSYRTSPNLAANRGLSPVLLSVPQFMPSSYLAPNMEHLGERPSSRSDSGLMYAEPLVFQAWQCGMCGGDNRFNTETCAHCESLNPNRPLIRAITQQQQHMQAFQPYSSSEMSSIPGLSPSAKSLHSVSPMVIMSKLTCHVHAILKLGTEGAKLREILVTGDVALCYAMGMRGLVGKEAINPWKCVGVDIPSQNFVKNVSKPPLGTIAGDWTCSCGRENWAKRTVCSRCFPGIEPEYKSLVFSKVKPVLDYIAVQEQSGEAQKDAEWLAAEERRLRQGHSKQMPGQLHNGPIIGKQFVADSKVQRQQSRSPRLQDGHHLEQQERHSGFPPHYYGYAQNVLMHHQMPSVGSFRPVYPYPTAQPSLGGYPVGHDAFAFQHPVAQEINNRFNSTGMDRERAPFLQPASSRFSLVESESASEYQFSPFSRSGSQQAMPKLGFTITNSSSVASVRTAASSSGKSLAGDQQGGQFRKLRSPSDSSLNSLDKKDQGLSPENSSAPDPFSPFSQPQLFAKQALQARHKSAKKAELRPTRSVSPIGHGRPDISSENGSTATTSAEHDERASQNAQQVQDPSFPSGDSYVNVLGSLLQDVHM